MIARPFAPHLCLPIVSTKDRIPLIWTVSEPEHTAGGTAVERYLPVGSRTRILCLHREFLLRIGANPFCKLTHCKETEDKKDFRVSNSSVAPNNSEWGAVRQSVLGIYPNGHAARTNQMPLTSLAPTPDFTMVARASRAWTASVEKASDLAGVLEEAIRQVAEGRTQALVEVRVAP